MLSPEKCHELLGGAGAELNDEAVVRLRDAIRSITERAVEVEFAKEKVYTQDEHDRNPEPTD